LKFILKKAETSVILTVFISDSSSTTGAGLGALDQTSGITGGYLKRNGTGVALSVNENVTTEGTYEAPTTAAQVRIGTPANMVTGIYELHFHNDLFTSADWITISLSGAANMAPILMEVQLTDIDFNDGIRAALTALPNAAADAAGGLPISDAGGLDLDTKLANTNEITAARMGALTDWIDAGRLDAILDTIAADVVNIDGAAMRGTDSAALASVCTEARLAELGATNLPADVDTILAGTVTNAQGADVATDVALLVGSDGKALISTDAQDLSATLDVNTKTLTADSITASALNSDAVTEIWAKAMQDLAQGAPSATASVLDAINYLYEAWRNKITTTATLITVMKDDGTTGLVKSIISDDGSTFTKDEFITGL